ncbi:thioesterase family protein [Paracoccus yeei]|uniref:thioesterase family protein n=1 Tax=Paracoccus yeei TaxID=147645 RepID=UPI0026D23F92
MNRIAIPDLPLTGDMMVPPEWTDYNGHMNEAFYLVAAAGATDRFLDMIGAGQPMSRLAAASSRSKPISAICPRSKAGRG